MNGLWDRDEMQKLYTQVRPLEFTLCPQETANFQRHVAADKLYDAWLEIPSELGELRQKGALQGV